MRINEKQQFIHQQKRVYLQVFKKKPGIKQLKQKTWNLRSFGKKN